VSGVGGWVGGWRRDAVVVGMVVAAAAAAATVAVAAVVVRYPQPLTFTPLRACHAAVHMWMGYYAGPGGVGQELFHGDASLGVFDAVVMACPAPTAHKILVRHPLPPPLSLSPPLPLSPSLSLSPPPSLSLSLSLPFFLSFSSCLPPLSAATLGLLPPRARTCLAPSVVNRRRRLQQAPTPLRSPRCPGAATRSCPWCSTSRTGTTRS
jgi:hypothetical protein